jgi:hypothetical protein
VQKLFSETNGKNGCSSLKLYVKVVDYDAISCSFVIFTLISNINGFAVLGN